MINRSNWRAVAAIAVLLVGMSDVFAEPIAPFPPGPYAVGCSNVAQDFSRVVPGATPRTTGKAIRQAAWRTTSPISSSGRSTR